MFCPKEYEPFSEERPWGNLLWRNLESLINSYNFPGIELIKIKFFEAPSVDPESYRRQQNYKNALLSLKTIDPDSFFWGEFRPKTSSCRECGAKYEYYVEKRTDVMISTEILTDYFGEECNATIVIGGDSDQVPVFEKIIDNSDDHGLYAIFPPHRKCKALANLLGEDNWNTIKYKRLVENQFPDELEIEGYTVRKPEEYNKEQNT